MLTPAEEHFILANAYVPEHIVGLMAYLSGGEPFLIDGYFCCQKDDWVISVGYPLGREFLEVDLESALEKVKRRFGFTAMWLIAPRLPASYVKQCQERESDFYYTLSAKPGNVKSALRRTLNKARDLLAVEQSQQTGKAHQEISQEFIERTKPHPRIRELVLKSLDYVPRSQKALVLNAWNKEHKLSAFYVMDMSAERFSTYVIGCHSKKNYVPGASDLLLHEAITISAKMNKEYVHLGLGVNEGIRRFKVKWGGKPVIPYEMGGMAPKRSLFLDLLTRFRIAT